jgi:hypothetical protein
MWRPPWTGPPGLPTLFWIMAATVPVGDVGAVASDSRTGPRSWALGAGQYEHACGADRAESGTEPVHGHPAARCWAIRLPLPG